MPEDKKGSKVMLIVGIVFVCIASVLLLGNFMGESTVPTVLGFLGVVFIGASNYRVMK